MAEYSTFHIYNQYTIALTNRDAVLTELSEAGIGSCIYYPVPFHRQPCFEYLGYAPNEFPITNKVCDEVLSIPIYPEMTSAEQDEVIDTIREVVG